MSTQPVSKVQGISVCVRLQEGPINVVDHLRLGRSDDLGALNVFVGQVRNHDPEAGAVPVAKIEDSSHPDAEAALKTAVQVLVEEAWPKGPGLFEEPFVTVIHRTGLLDVGDVALLVVVGSAHREPGLTLVGEIVERVKETLPVWKKQALSDGTAKWSNLP